MKEQQDQNAKSNKVAKAERKDSFSYALKSLKQLTEKLERNNWADNADIETLKQLQKKLVEKYIGLDLY